MKNSEKHRCRKESNAKHRKLLWKTHSCSKIKNARRRREKRPLFYYLILDQDVIKTKMYNKR